MPLFHGRPASVVPAGYHSAMLLSSRVVRSVIDVMLFLMSAGALAAAIVFSL